MEEFAEFLDDLLGGFELAALSLTVGGVVWGLFVLRAWRRRPDGGSPAMAWCVGLLVIGAASLMAVQLAVLAIKPWILWETLDRSPFPAFLHTIQFKARLARTVIAAALAAAAWPLRRGPGTLWRWSGVGCIALLLLITGAWLTHAESRLEDRGPLMALTTLHQLAAAAWAGGVAQLVALWRLKRRHPQVNTLWPVALWRFSAVGIAAVFVIVTTGAALAWAYVGSWRGLVGTSYGAIVITKLVLLSIALGFAAFNFSATRRWSRTDAAAVLRQRVPHIVEGETVVLFALLFWAAAMTTQPPAVDTEGATATWAEVAWMFTPKLPHLTSPSAAAAFAAVPGPLTPPVTGPTAATGWSDFNHNAAGLFVLAMAIVALLERTTNLTAARHWPLGFVALAVFLTAHGIPRSWPLGPVPFWTSLMNGEVLQHRLAAVLTLAIGLFEWRARSPRMAETWLPYMFPVLTLAGGILLLTHRHEGFVLKTEYLQQISHIAMGMLAILVACGRWLELRMAPPAGRLAGIGAATAMLLIGMILTFYREPVL